MVAWVIKYAPTALRNKIDAFMLVKAGKPIEAKKTPQSGRITVATEQRKIDIRYERHPTHRGYHVTMRLLDKQQVELTLGKGSLIFNPKVMEYLRRVIALPDGIILISGPTGSGKSSTVTAILNELNRDQYNIVNLENPVEEETQG